MTMNNVEDFFGINNWDNNNHHNSNNNNNNGASSLPSLSPSSSSYSNSSTSTTSIVVDPLTDQQEIVISMLGIISGTLSILGSTTIIIKIIRSRIRNNNNNTSTTTPYDRIMLGLSSFDIIASLSWVLTPFLMPSMDNSLIPRVWAVGNAASCTFLGTLTQLGFCAVIYNLVLSFYYLLTVRFGMKRREFNKKLEPWIHIIPILYFVITAFSGAIIGLYSEVDIGMGCWVNDYPQGCADDEDPDSCTSPTIGWFFGGFPTVLTFLAIIINNIMIYLYVKKNLKIDNNKSIKNKEDDDSSSMKRCDSDDNDDEDQELEQQHQQEEEEEEERLRIDRRRRELLRKRYISDVATQGFLYVCTFLMSYTPAFALRALEVYGSHPISGQRIYPLLAVTATFLPLQGFCNMFVYNRLYYRKLRKAY